MSNVTAQLNNNKLKICSAFLVFVMALMVPDFALSDQSSGLKMSLYTEGGSTRFTLEDTINIVIQMENATRWPINAPRGFSQVELHRALVITDPGGKKHILTQEELATDMPPPFFWSDKETVPAEILDTDWVRTVEIDLGKVFGMINTRPGVYTIEARQPFTRFPWTIKGSLGLMGIVDELDLEGYWKGDVESDNIIKIIVVPTRGGRFNLRLLDLGLNLPVCQAQVRVYKAEDIPEDMPDKDVWETKNPVMAGSTDFQGWAVWEDGRPCMPEGDYIAIGFYQEEYKSADFEPAAEDWNAGCGGLLERRIYFNEPQLYEFSIFGLNSVHIESKARVLSGDVGAQSESSEPLIEGYEIALDPWVKIKEGVSVRGDSIFIGEGTRVWDVYGNEINNSGYTTGEITETIPLPLWQGLPSLFPYDFTPGTEDHAIGPEGRMTLTDATRYGDVAVGSFAKLLLEPGTYYFNSLTLDTHARLVCLGPTEIHVTEKLEAKGSANYIGPILEKYLRPRDVMIYVAGSGDAVSIGKTSLVRANIFARNGNFSTGTACWLAGSFYANDVTIGPMSVVSYDGYFRLSDTEGDPNSSGIMLTVEKSSWWFTKLADLIWAGASSEMVDVYRNGRLRTQTENDGEYSDNLGWRPSGAYNYKVCEAGTEKCSEIVSIEY